METRSLAQLSLNDFLNRLAAETPTPGGGSVAALTGALAAALGRMVAAFTIGKPRFAAVEPEIRRIAERLARAEAMFRALIDEDAAAYEVLSAALKLDKAAPERRERVAQAAGLAASVPWETTLLAWKTRFDLEDLARICNPQLRSDATAATYLAIAATHASVANVRANLPLLAPAEADRMKKQLEALGPGFAAD